MTRVLLRVVAALLLAGCVFAEKAGEDKKEAPKQPTPLKGPQSANVVELTDENLDKELRKDDKNWYIHFYADFCGDPCIKADEAMDVIADKFKGQLHVGRMKHNQVSLRRFSVVDYPSIIYYRKGKFYRYDEGLDQEELYKFAAGDFKHNKEHTLPEAEASNTHAIPLTDKTFDEKVFARRGAYWVVLFYHKDDYKPSQLRTHYEALAEHLRGKINVGMIETADGPKTFKRMGIKETPSIFVFRGGKRYNIEDTEFEMVGEDLIQWAEGGYEKSKDKAVEALPEKPLRPEGVEEEAENPDSLVQILTDQDFDEKTGAIKGNKGVWFVEFYTPWCGHCKAMAPIWEEIAVKLREKMTVAKIDCTINKNTTERFGIPGFPTLLLFRDGKFYRYNGERRLAEDISAWAIKGWKEQEGAFVPPPVGVELAPPTLAEELADVVPALQAIYQEKPYAANTLIAFGGALGFCLFTYLYFVRWILLLSSGSKKAAATKKKQ